MYNYDSNWPRCCAWCGDILTPWESDYCNQTWCEDDWAWEMGVVDFYDDDWYY